MLGKGKRKISFFSQYGKSNPSHPRSSKQTHKKKTKSSNRQPLSPPLFTFPVGLLMQPLFALVRFFYFLLRGQSISNFCFSLAASHQFQPPSITVRLSRTWTKR